MTPMIDFQKAPKQFCDNIAIAHTEEYFAIALMNGEAGSAYAISPGHAKRLQQYLTHQIGEYEKTFGPITTPDWSPDIKSPLEMQPPTK